MIFWAACVLLLQARSASAFVIQAACSTRQEGGCILRATFTEETLQDYQTQLEASSILKTAKAKIAPVEGRRLGLVATQNLNAGEVVVAIPYDDQYEMTAALAPQVFGDIFPEEYDGWTGDAGLISLLVLNEIALVDGKGTPRKRPKALESFMQQWATLLPLELDHPLLWSEEDQEVLQCSSTKKIYRQLDDIEEDATWLVENIFSKDSQRFPSEVTLDGRTVPCFSVEGFKWAMACVQSRSFFVDGSLRLMPVLDMCNHADDGEEIRGGTMGTFGTTKGAQLVASKACKSGEEVCCSYGPKSAADYLLEHGFCPEQSFKTAVSELTFEVDPDDRFRDDKLDILEFETYDQAPMDPNQSFDVVSVLGRDGEPDPAMIQFVRLCKLGSTDAFLLESIFRKEVWGFMELPVSEANELAVVNAILEACQSALDEFAECPDGGPDICQKIRESETRALTRTMEYLQRDREALDLKEYYQERRLKDLGLDSDWSPEDDISPDLGYGQTRVPGGADYDW